MVEEEIRLRKLQLVSDILQIKRDWMHPSLDALLVENELFQLQVWMKD